ncbi:bifunctional pyr operon transcriptional regulator/uracil phosphoribosyltransferase PyrR [bacterium]|nr:bifunctional pyr operon transcriptional regulator/uracil phosphoribosyltransferase PyrR [candidate division CSSED10-310 bacterium]
MADKNRPKTIMSTEEIESFIKSFAQDICHQYSDLENIAIVGIQTGGAHLARRLADAIKTLTNHEINLGILDITLYRDDLALDKEQPLVKQTDLPFKISGKILILFDDVLYTGRTVRAALDAIIDFGRPKAIRLAVLIDRGLREFPIRPDYIGRYVKTEPDQKVHVCLTEEGFSEDKVLIEMGE